MILGMPPAFSFKPHIMRLYLRSTRDGIIFAKMNLFVFSQIFGGNISIRTYMILFDLHKSKQGNTLT